MTEPTSTAETTAPADSSPTRPPKGNDRRQRRGQPTVKAASAKRPPREVHPVLQKLFELYPGLFGARFLPLKLGVFQELLALHPDAFKRDDLKVALGLHARSTRYLESVAAGHPRHDLQGQPVEPVAPEHVHHAIVELFRRRQGRTKDDLRPEFCARIVKAIEASGLGKEDYAERVRTQDDTANALLDAALTELAAQTAKREALMRAFEASGKTEAEFADMYGMSFNEVSHALARVRASREQLTPTH
ncbi:ProQ/FINO family protein [Polaromonas sp. YR568]|uniref:ProQ/FINO family protein n=1 Tax=Polaromonas sp. YR568 TaxID=1855301 RepID=UPI003137D375